MKNPDADKLTCLYKLTHKNHPNAIWARVSTENYFYLYSLAVLLGEEYTYRYNKIHKSISLVEVMPSPDYVPVGVFTEPPKCVHDDFKQVPDVVEAYRQYYMRDKRHFCVWTKRTTPPWYA